MLSIISHRIEHANSCVDMAGGCHQAFHHLNLAPTMGLPYDNNSDFLLAGVFLCGTAINGVLSLVLRLYMAAKVAAYDFLFAGICVQLGVWNAGTLSPVRLITALFHGFGPDPAATSVFLFPQVGDDVAACDRVGDAHRHFNAWDKPSWSGKPPI